MEFDGENLFNVKISFLTAFKSSSIFVIGNPFNVESHEVCIEFIDIQILHLVLVMKTNSIIIQTLQITPSNHRLVGNISNSNRDQLATSIP